MNRPNYLILHKTEWDRLNRREDPKTKLPDRSEYLKLLIEQSQNWMKKWPDTVQGHVYQLKKQKENEHNQMIRTVKEFHLKSKEDIKTDAIRKARDMLFEDSCYGRQLLSAFIESKTLEERDKQILFQKEIKRIVDLQKRNEPKATSIQNSSEMESTEKRIAFLKKQRDINIALTNKAMADKKKAKQIYNKEKEKKERLKDEYMITQLLEREKEIKINQAKLRNNAIDHYESYTNQIKINRAKREEEDERRREIYRKYQDRISCREKIVFDKIHKHKYNPQIFELIKNINDEKSKQYNEFVDKGIKSVMDKDKTQEKAESEKKVLERNQRKSLDEENKLLAKLQQQLNLEEKNKYTCRRQSIIGNSCYKPKKTNNSTDPSFLLTKNTLLEDLKRREKEPIPWSALSNAHAQFARHASDTLRQCRYKNTARKVIDDYRKINCLDAKSLPISEK